MRAWFTLPVLWIAASATTAGAGQTVEQATHALDDARWEVRRRAENDLVKAGQAALQEPVPAGTVGSGLKAWAEAVGAVIEKGSPTASAAAERCIRSVEEGLPDDVVRGEPRLLRARLERLLPQTVWLTTARASRRAEDPLSGETAIVETTGLLPEAMPVLLSIVDGSTDVRRLAGALAALAGESRAGPDDAAVLRWIADAWVREPGRFANVSPYATATSDQYRPVALVALALATEGHAADAAGLLAPSDEDPELRTVEIVPALSARLKARNQADLTYGRFLAGVFEGAVTAADVEEAASAALAADLPWIARLVARRALFLAQGSERARRTLVQADEALGLRATAREDAASGGAPPPASAPAVDESGAHEIDALLLGGILGQRLVARTEAGTARQFGAVPVALGGGTLAFGEVSGRVVIADAATGALRYTVPPRAKGLPLAVALSDGRLAAVSARFELSIWELGATGAKDVAHDAGPWYAVASAPGGGFFAAGADGRLARVTASGEVTPLSAPRHERRQPSSLHVLANGRLLVTTPDASAVVDVSTGKEDVAFADPDGALRAATYGNDVVVATGSAYARVATDGRVRWRREADDGPVVGVAGDPASGAVYLTTSHALISCDAGDGSLRWSEPVEGSASAAVGDGMVAVPAGTGSGRMGGDGREDRTVSLLRGSLPKFALFEPPSRKRILDAAEAAARRGKPMVARMIMDPLLSWFTEDEAARIDDLLDR